ncbi:uncharacterized protein LOC125034207 [Penaeus chinensis]|uniref:uncharacterized protein LOC125034207 n=1 Tax=Penaeus chinensis TaxID=139456 RepID=UPI001FB5AF5B|nr:uncharacterized protein LOC125034207 [Penaeus chinensis]
MSKAQKDPKEQGTSSPGREAPGSEVNGPGAFDLKGQSSFKVNDPGVFEVTDQGSIEVKSRGTFKVNGTAEASEGGPAEEDVEERIVQISTPTHARELLACVGKLRHAFSTADVNIVVRGEVFRAHRFLVTHFSKFLARALSPKAGEAVTGPNVVFVEKVEADIMAYLLDYMYGNLAILKESKLLRFLCAARWLEIDCLQTPGLKSLERNLTKGSSGTPCGASFSEGRETEGATGGDRGGGTPWDILLPSFKFPSSLEITQSPSLFGGHSGDGRSGASTVSREQASKQKDEGDSGAKQRGKCCHCSCRREGEAGSSGRKEESDGAPETKEEATTGSGDEEAQTLMKKLEKYGTKITGNTLSMLQVPAWLFSSKNISITPAKENHKNVRVSAADESTADEASLGTQDEADKADAPVIIGTSPPQPPVPPKRNLMAAFQTSTRAQGDGRFPRGDLGHPWPRGSRGKVREPYAMNQRYPAPRFNSVPRIQQNPRNRLQTPYPRQMPSAVPESVPMTQKSNRGRGYVMSPPHGNGFKALGTPRSQSTPSLDAGKVNTDWDRKLSQQARVIVNNILSPRGRLPSSPSGRGPRHGRGRPPCLPHSHSPSLEGDVTKPSGGNQDHFTGTNSGPLSSSGNGFFQWDGREPLEVRDTGIVIQLPDNAAELIAGATVLTPVAPGLDDGRSLDLQVAQTSFSSYQAPVTFVGGPPCPAEQQVEQQNPLPDDNATAFAPNESLDATLLSEDIGPHGNSSSFEGFSGDVTESESQPQAPPQPAAGPEREETAEGEVKEQLAKDENCSNAASAQNVSRRTRGRPCKTFRCPVCKKMFSNSSALVMHQRQHVGERPRYCSSCAFRSEAQSTLVSHVKRKHGRLLQECEKVCHPAPEIDPNSSSKKRKKKDKKEEEERKEEVNSEEKGKVENTEQSAGGNGEPIQNGNDDKGEIPDQAENSS